MVKSLAFDSAVTLRVLPPTSLAGTGANIHSPAMPIWFLRHSREAASRLTATVFEWRSTMGEARLLCTWRMKYVRQIGKLLFDVRDLK